MKGKTLLIAGGIIAALVVIYLLFQNSQSASSAIGTGTLPSTPSGSSLSTLLSGLGSGSGSSVLSGLEDSFGSGSSGSNDPGLEDDDD